MNTQDKIHFYHSASTWMEGRAVEQLKQTAALPGVTAAAGMPDLHPGLSAPVGAAVQTEKIIYPELVGGDAGCGMAFFRTTVPAGKFKAARLERRLLSGGIPVPEADFPAEWPDWLRRELGTLGHGNHFAELQELAGIRLPDRARELGLDRRNLWLLVHSGSRGHGPALLERTPKGGLDPGSEAGVTTVCWRGRSGAAASPRQGFFRWPAPGANAFRTTAIIRLLPTLSPPAGGFTARARLRRSPVCRS